MSALMSAVRDKRTRYAHFEFFRCWPDSDMGLLSLLAMFGFVGATPRRWTVQSNGDQLLAGTDKRSCRTL